MRLKFSFTLWAVLAGMLVVAIAYLADRQIVMSYNQALEGDLLSGSREVDALVRGQYQSFKEDVNFLHATPPISGLTRAKANAGIDPLDGTTTELWKSRLGQIFTSFMENNLAYFQLRILDSKGQEIVRVDRLENKVVRRAENDLQDKSERYYFQESVPLAEEQMFVSVIDLNREHGKLAFPYIPTLRLAKPIYAQDNQFFGVLVVNIDARYFLQSINHIVTGKYDIILADVDGYFIKHPDKTLQYSRDLAPEQRISSLYEEIPMGSLAFSQYKKTNGDLYWGVKEKLVVAGHERGGQLISLIKLPDTTYQQELSSRRWNSFLALAGVLAITLFGLYLLNRNNQRLARLLSIAEEAKAAVDVAEDAVVTVNKNWHINTVNRAFERLFLVHFDDIKGSNIADVFNRFGDHIFSSCVNEGSLEDHSSNVKQYDFKGYEWCFSMAHDESHGEPRWLHTKIAKVNSTKSNAAFAIVISDISSEKLAIMRVEEANKGLEQTVAERTHELQLARDKALEVSKLKSSFISTISHEMRTPLNGIVGTTALLKKESLNEKQAKLVQMAEYSVEALRQLINDVLDLSKIEAGKLELNYRNFNPEALIESVTSTMSVVANQKNIGFYVDTSDLGFVSVYSDPHRLTQVINNLLSNAIKFTEEGHVLVKAWSEFCGELSWLCVEVSDTGPGVAKANIAKLFQSFSQVDSSITEKYGGTGLGLSICKEIVALLGGDISVTSEPEKGSTFAFKVLLEKWQAKNTEGHERLINTQSGLLIENTPLHTIVTRLIAGDAGESLDIAPPFHEEALAHLTLVLVDREHPNYEEFASFWKSMSERGVSCPRLIVLTKLSQPQSNEEALQGAIYLVKPLYRSVFLSTVLDFREGNQVVPNYLTKGLPSTARSNNRENDAYVALNYRILVVDDNDINAQLARFILEPQGMTVEVAMDGEQAIATLKASLEENARREAFIPFDLVLMDCNMPVMNGYDATRLIRQGQAGEAYISIPIIAMTANAMKGESEKCQIAGMDDYITKPVDSSLLMHKIEELLAKKDVTNEIKPSHPDEPYDAYPAQALWQKESSLIRLAGKEDLLKQLIELFIQISEKRLNTLLDALVQQDREQLYQLAHAFKGVCGDVGAEALYQSLSELEEQASDVTFAHLEQILVRVRIQLHKTLLLFKAYLSEE